MAKEESYGLSNGWDDSKGFILLGWYRMCHET